MPVYSQTSPRRRAAIFINWGVPLGFGHVGWGFEKMPGDWYYGAVEIAGGWGVVRKGDDNKIFNKLGTEDQMLSEMKKGSVSGGPLFYYNEYKFVDVPNGDYKPALTYIAKARANGYGLLGNNCMDAVFRVIKAYANGDDNFLPHPSKFWAPRWWYCDVKAKSKFLRKDTGIWGFFT